MSTTVDNRVISMRFDNEEFEKKATKSISTLDKLKDALKFSGTSKDLDGVNKSFKEVDANPLLNAINGIGSGFTTMIAKATIVSRATNALIDSTKRFVSSMSVDQINAGWDKYAEKTSAVQTIMAATAKDFSDTGKQMTYVNDQLEKLNWFTDETSYNFVDMVSNIGKFTSNGIKLDKSVTAMQGIATWAAVSGANANEASRAMYNLSQALSTGSVKFIDWKSIESANMATVEFKENAIEAAVALGTLEKAGDGTYRTMQGNAVSVTNFNQALSDAWLTSDVLMNVLDRYGDFTNKLYEVSEATDRTATQLLQDVELYSKGALDLESYAEECGLSIEEVTAYMEDLSSETYALGKKSFKAAQEAKTFAEAISATSDAVSTGWMKSFELIFGNYEEAKKLWTNLSNILYEVFAASGDVRNELLGEWKSAGGRTTMLEGINNLLEAILRLVTPIKDAFREIFPAKTSQDLLNLTNKFSAFTKSLQLNSKQMSKVKSVARGVFSVFDLIFSTVKGLASSFANALNPSLKIFGNGVLDILGALGDYIYMLSVIAKENTTVSKIFEGIGKTAGNLITIIQKLVSQFRQSTVGQASFKVIQTVLSKSVDLAGKLLKYISTVAEKIAGLEHISFSNIFDILAGVAGDTFDWFKNFSIDISDSDGVLDKFRSGVESACSQVGISFTKLSNGVTKAFETIRYWLEDIPWGQLIAIGLGLYLISGINKIFTSLSGLVNAFAKLTMKTTTSIKDLINSITGTFNALSSAIKSPTYLKVAKAIGILAASLFALAQCDTEQLWNAVAALGAVAAGFVVMTHILAKLPETAAASFAAIGVMGKTIVALAAAIWILTAAFKNLDDTNPQKLVGSLVLVGVTLVALTAATVYMNKGITRLSDVSGNVRSTNTAAKNVLAMAASIWLIATAIEGLSDIHIVDIKSTCIAVVGTIGSVIAITLALSKVKGTDGLKGSAALLAACLSVFAVMKAVEKLAECPWPSYINGLGKAIVLIGVLGIFFATTNLIGENAAKAGALMAGVGISVYLIIGAIAVLGSIKEETLSKGINAISGITICFMGLMIASNLIGENAHKMSVTLLAAAAAMGICAVIATIMGTIPSDVLKKGTLVIAGIGGVFAALMAATGIAKNLGKDITLLTTMLIAVGVMVAALTLIDDPEGIKAAGVAIAAVFAAMSVVLAATSIANMSLKVAGALAGALIALAAMSALLAYLNSNIDNPENAIKMAEALGLFAAEFSVMILVFAAVAKIIGNAQVSILSLGKIAIAVVGTIALILGLIGGISYLIGGIPDDFASNCQKVGEAIGALVGGLVGGLAGGAMTALGNGLASFGNAMAGVDTDKLKAGLGCLIDAAKGLAAVSLEGLFQLFTGSFGVAAMPKQMTALGTALSNFGEALGDTDISRIEAAIPAITALAEIGNILPPSGGVFQLFGGEHNFGTFGAQLALFGVAFNLYSKALNGTDLDIITQSLEPVRALVEIGNELPESGIFGLFFGQQDFGMFGVQLACFGHGLNLYSKKLKGVDIDLITKSIPAVEALVAIGNALPKSPSLFSLFTGAQDFSVFGDQLAWFGGSFKKYYKEIKNVDFDKINASTRGARALVEIANLIPEDNLFDWLIGNDGLDDFGDKLAGFGEGMAKYYEAISGVNLETVNGSNTLLENVLSLAEAIPTLEEYDFTTLSDFGSKLKTFGDNLVTFFIDMATVAQTSALGPLVSSVWVSVNQIKGYIDDFEQAGKDCVDGLIKGLSDEAQKTKLRTAGKTIGETVLDAFSNATGWGSPWATMIQAGKDCVTGLMIGLKKNESKTDKAGYTLGDEFVGGFRDATGWHSPPEYVLEFIKDCAKALGDNGSAITKAIASGNGVGTAFVSALYNKLISKGKTAKEAMDIIVKAMEGEAYGSIESLVEAFGFAFDTSMESESGSMASSMEDAVTSATSGALGSFTSSGTTAADAFMTALEDRISDYDLDISTIDLETELWEATLGRNATDPEKKTREMQDLQKKIDIQNGVVQSANEKYEYAVKKFGQTSEDAKKAYQSLLQEQIELANLMNEINDARGTAQQNTADSMVAYAKWIAEGQEDLLKLGFTMEEISAAASQATGYNLQNTTETMTQSVTGAVTTAMSTVQTTYASVAESTLGSLTQNFSDYGTVYSTAIGTGMANSSYQVGDGAETAANAGLNALSDTSGQWYNLGLMCGEGFKQGILDKADDIATSAAAVANAAFAAVQFAIDSHSPSRKFMWLGEMADMGLIVGFNNLRDNVADSASEVSLGAIEAARTTISHISDILEADDALHPEIQPILDLSQVRNGMRGISGSIGGITLSTRSANLQANAVASSIGTKTGNINQESNGSGQNGSQNFNFVQNNYSPKSLSRAEIYRNTNNQFSAFKEAVSKT